MIRDCGERLFLQECVGRDTGFAEYGAQGAFGHVAGMVWKRDLASGVLVTPHFVAAGSWPVEAKTQRPKFPGDLNVIEPRQPSHLGHTHGNPQIHGSGTGIQMGQRGRQGIAVFDA